MKNVDELCAPDKLKRELYRYRCDDCKFEFITKILHRYFLTCPGCSGVYSARQLWREDA